MNFCALRHRTSLFLQTILPAVLFVSLFLLFEGYEFGVGNQTVFLPVIDSFFKAPQLQSDFGVASRFYYHPFFNMTLSGLGQFIPQEPLFAAVQLLTLVLLYRALTQLADLFKVDGPTRFLTLLLMLFWKQQGLDGNVFWANRVESQYLAWPLFLFAVNAFLRSRYGRAGLFCGAVTFLHLQMGALTSTMLCAAAVLISDEECPRRQRLLRIIAGSALLTLPTILFFSKILFSGEVLIGPRYVQYALLRSKHHMELDLRLFAGFLFFTVLPWLILEFNRWHQKWPQDLRTSLKKLAILQTLLMAAGILQYADYYLQIGILARLQLLRLLPFVYLTGLMLSAWILIRLIQSEKAVFRFAAVAIIFVIGPRWVTYVSLTNNLIFVIVSACATLWLLRKPPPHPPLTGMVLFLLILVASTVHWKPPLDLSVKGPPLQWTPQERRHDPWYDLCYAVKSLVPQSALVLNPPHRQGFVYLSQRAAFVEFKFGANFSRTYTEWQKRLKLAGGISDDLCHSQDCLKKIAVNYNLLTAEAILNIERLYKARYFVTESNSAYPFKKLYQNSRFKLYELPHSSLDQASISHLQMEGIAL